MQIELIGCTSAGKSVLTKSILQGGHNLGVDMVTSYDFVLSKIGLDWIKNHSLRMFVLNVFASIVCLLSWRKNREFYSFVSGVILRLPATVTWLEKLKIARIFARNVGIYETVNRYGSDRLYVLADEGTIHIVHYLFVHVSVEPDLADIKDYLKLAPMPDLAIYLQKDEDVLIERTLARGHKRIPDGTLDAVSLFIKHAEVTFDHSVQLLTSNGLPLMVVNDNGITRVNQDNENDPISTTVLETLQAGFDVMKANAAQIIGESNHGYISVAT